MSPLALSAASHQLGLFACGGALAHEVLSLFGDWSLVGISGRVVRKARLVWHAYTNGSLPLRGVAFSVAAVTHFVCQSSSFWLRCNCTMSILIFLKVGCSVNLVFLALERAPAHMGACWADITGVWGWFPGSIRGVPLIASVCWWPSVFLLHNPHDRCWVFGTFRYHVVCFRDREEVFLLLGIARHAHDYVQSWHLSWAGQSVPTRCVVGASKGGDKSEDHGRFIGGP